VSRQAVPASPAEQCPVNPSGPFIQRPVATALLMAAILLVGSLRIRSCRSPPCPRSTTRPFRYSLLSRRQPQCDGHNCHRSVGTPVRPGAGLSQMTSTSSGGSSVIVLQFDLSLNIDIAEEEVQSSINASQSFLHRTFQRRLSIARQIRGCSVLTLAITSDSIPLSQVEDMVDTRLAPSSQLSGVGLVSISGGQKPAVRIQANPRNSHRMGLTLKICARRSPCKA